MKKSEGTNDEASRGEAATCSSRASGEYNPFVFAVVSIAITNTRRSARARFPSNTSSVSGGGDHRTAYIHLEQ